MAISKCLFSLTSANPPTPKRPSFLSVYNLFAKLGAIPIVIGMVEIPARGRLQNTKKL
jgi:hypothetical protein